MRIVVGSGSCGIAAGAQKVYDAIESLLTNKTSTLGVTGCIGMCYLEPIVDLYEEDKLLARLVRVCAKDAENIVKAAESGDLSFVKDLVITEDDEKFLSQQTRIALRHCGIIDPTQISDYMKEDGYKVKNLSVAIQAEKPRLSKYIDAMRERLALLLEIPLQNVGITAGTNEKLGYVGEGKGVTVYASVLLYRP